LDSRKPKWSEYTDIIGSSNICTTGIYSVPVSNDATIVWSISPTNAGTFQGQGTNQIQFSLNTSYSGLVTLSAQITLVECDGRTVTLTKQVWGGKPNFNFDTEWDPASGRLTIILVGPNGSNISLQGISPDPSWVVTGTAGNPSPTANNCTGFECVARGPRDGSTDWSVQYDITATNACGTSIVSISASPRAGIAQRRYNFVSNPNYVYTINTIEGDVSKPVENFEHLQQDFIIKVYDFTGNPVLETKETKIDISNLKSGIYILKALIDDTVLTKKVFR